MCLLCDTRIGIAVCAVSKPCNLPLGDILFPKDNRLIIFPRNLIATVFHHHHDSQLQKTRDHHTPFSHQKAGYVEQVCDEQDPWVPTYETLSANDPIHTAVLPLCVLYGRSHSLRCACPKWSGSPLDLFCLFRTKKDAAAIPNAASKLISRWSKNIRQTSFKEHNETRTVLQIVTANTGIKHSPTIRSIKFHHFRGLSDSKFPFIFVMWYCLISAISIKRTIKS